MGRRMDLNRLILASGSARRKELLQAIHLPFEVFVPEVDESTDLPAGEAVVELSRRKGAASAPRYPGSFILSADTLVEQDGFSLGKPRDREDALRMLRLLSGREHRVYTGMTVINPAGEVFSGADRADVTFCKVPEEELAAYAESSEPFDKAGGYAIQGRAGLWVSKINGNPSCVIGLSLFLLRDLLLKAGYPLSEVLKNKTEG